MRIVSITKTIKSLAIGRKLAFIILLVTTTATFGQSALRGTITNESGEGLPGVTILILNKGTGTISDIDGSYQLGVDFGDTLKFSFIGYQEQTRIYAGDISLDIVLSENLTELQEVIVTGYSTQYVKDLTGSIAVVKADAITELNAGSMDQALQGQAAGVQVVKSSGTPGGGISVRIRGSTSISASNRPLFIIDGVPVEDGGLSLRSFGGQSDNALALLNTNDIESIQILKDASSKAIYGSRAANGVVLITTKRGSQNKTQFSMEVQRGIIDPTNKIDMLNSEELLEIQREAAINAGQNPEALGLIRGINDVVNTDWQDEVLRTGILSQYQFSARGGDETNRVFISLNYRGEEGVQLNNEFNRLSGTINLDHRANARLSLGSNMSISRTRNERVKGDNFLDGVYSGAIKSLPYYPVYNEQGELTAPGDSEYPGFPNFNPVAQAVIPRFTTIAYKFLGGLFADYKINDDFALRSQASVDFNSVTEDQFESSKTAIGGFLQSVGGSGYGIFITGVYSSIIANSVLRYNKQFSDHTITALAGTEALYKKNRTSSVQGRLFPSDDFTYITSAGVVDAGSSGISESGLLSFFTEAKYNYQEKYFAGATVRADGSSRFGSGNRFGIFPSASFAWRISDEAFFDIGVIEDFKLRASYGLTGNERFGNFRFLGTFGAVTYNGASGVAPGGLGNEFLQWENTSEFNSGFDLSMIESKLQVNVDVYYNRTDKLLFSQPLPLTTGFGSVTGNIGEVANRGIEFNMFSVNWDRDIKWTTNVNLSKNINKVVYLVDTIPLNPGYSGNGVAGTNVIREGEPLGSFWGLNFLGVDIGTGNAIYEDLDGDGEITPDDATVIGNAQPDLIGGITNSVSYKGLEVSIFFQFSYGNQILNFTKTGTLNLGENLDYNQHGDARRRWQEPGDVTDIPKYELGNAHNNLHSSRFIEDGSYLRLKNLRASYNIPQRWVEVAKLRSARAFVTADNLWTLTSYTGSDPEVSTLDGSTSAQGIDFYTLPQVRTITLGLSIGL
ncbi:MAG: TonB-dependent receptor [Cyclobacteriaceae bacterium]